MRGKPDSALIITADDFGLHLAVNEAVEEAYRHGILTAASLMVAGAAAADAVVRAQRCPGLRVGLHLVLADGKAMLPRQVIPDLIDDEGCFGNQMVRDGFRFFFRPAVRRQLASEIRAQFEAFAATGLSLDHVNAHKHFHLHPTILSLILSIGRDFGLRAVRLPLEYQGSAFLKFWLLLMRARLSRAGVAHNDWIAGLSQTGALDEVALLSVLARLRPGITEIYCHPAVTEGALLQPTMRSYRHDDELAALVSSRVREAILRLDVPMGGFADLMDAPSRF